MIKVIDLYKILFSLLILFLFIETLSFIALTFSNSPQLSNSYFNRQLSGYYIFGNTPGYKYKKCIKRHKDEIDVIIDKYGFVYNKSVVKIKPSNVIRIFLTGGSMAFGNGQSIPYNKILEYPQGIYSYESSIAGILEKKLQQKYPLKSFEVINACASGRMLNQSIAYYLETIKEFSPDIIISIDGMNDISTICGISPYLVSNISLEQYLTLYERSKYMKKNYFSSFIGFYKQFKQYQMEKKSNKEILKKSAHLFDYSDTKYTYNDYILDKKRLIRNSKTFTKLILYYNALCQSDQVEFVFCLQPLLYRTLYNKKLSNTELLMRKNINPINFSLSNQIFPPFIIEKVEKQGNIVLKYFIDDFLSDDILKMSLKKDFTYIDLNKEITNVTASTEFYIDYCHLTFEGNQIIAEILINKIASILQL